MASPNTQSAAPDTGESPVSVIVVSFNTSDKLRRCLRCIEAGHEVIVVDNASSDGSPDMVQTEFPHARLIRNSENRGFGAANNQGLDVMTRDLALFLNSDCYAVSGAISKLAEALDPDSAMTRSGGKSIVAAGGKLLNPDATLQDSVAGELTLWRVLWEQLNLDRFGPFRYWHTREAAQIGEKTSRPVPVVQVTGACLMMGPIERFDERFFLYCEDTELCYRLRAHGQIVYVAGAEFTHDLGSSSSEKRWWSIAMYNRGKELFFAVHKDRSHAAICFLLNRLGAILRMLVWAMASIVTLFLVPRFRSQAATFARVLACPISGPNR